MAECLHGARRAPRALPVRSHPSARASQGPDLFPSSCSPERSTHQDAEAGAQKRGVSATLSVLSGFPGQETGALTPLFSACR